MSTLNFSQEEMKEAIARRAEEIWYEEGRPEGKALDHWLRAEQELKVKALIRSERQNLERWKSAKKGADASNPTQSAISETAAAPSSSASATRPERKPKPASAAQAVPHRGSTPPRTNGRPRAR